MESWRKTLTLHLTITLESKNFNTMQTWVGMYSKYTVYLSADIYFLWAVDVRNKKKEGDRELELFWKW